MIYFYYEIDIYIIIYSSVELSPTPTLSIPSSIEEDSGSEHGSEQGMYIHVCMYICVYVYYTYICICK